MSKEVVRVLKARLAELKIIEAKQEAKLREEAPVRGFLELQREAIAFINSAEPGERFTEGFKAKLDFYVRKERRLKAKIKEVCARDYSKMLDELLKTQALIREISWHISTEELRESINNEMEVGE